VRWQSWSRQTPLSRILGRLDFGQSPLFSPAEQRDAATDLTAWTSPGVTTATVQGSGVSDRGIQLSRCCDHPAPLRVDQSPRRSLAVGPQRKTNSRHQPQCDSRLIVAIGPKGVLDAVGRGAVAVVANGRKLSRHEHATTAGFGFNAPGARARR